eukprot:Platyproteum_vivax@DN2731_c0_g1_i1.p1
MGTGSSKDDTDTESYGHNIKNPQNIALKGDFPKKGMSLSAGCCTAIRGDPHEIIQFEGNQGTTKSYLQKLEQAEEESFQILEKARDHKLGLSRKVESEAMVEADAYRAQMEKEHQNMLSGESKIQNETQREEQKLVAEIDQMIRSSQGKQGAAVTTIVDRTVHIVIELPPSVASQLQKRAPPAQTQSVFNRHKEPAKPATVETKVKSVKKEKKKIEWKFGKKKVPE